MISLILAKILAYLRNKLFLRFYGKSLKKVEIGTSFSPEHFRYLDSSLDPIEALKIIRNELNITDLRIGIRWSNDFGENLNSLEKYKEFFEYCFQSDFKLTLNLGPIKTFRWPEEHVPKEILKQLKKVPKNGLEIPENHPIYKFAFRYLRKLIKDLKKYDLRNVHTIQIDNEPFYCFGQFGWKMNKNYLKKVIEVVVREFPDKRILISSAGRENLQQIINLIQKFNQETPAPHPKFTIGVNYYFKVPGHQFRDNLVLADRSRMTTKKFKQEARKLRIEIEVSELQVEPWQEITSPGNSIRDFRFALIRSINQILDLKNNSDSKKVIRIWGIEELVRKTLRKELSKENSKIFETIKSINI